MDKRWPEFPAIVFMSAFEMRLGAAFIFSLLVHAGLFFVDQTPGNISKLSSAQAASGLTDGRAGVLQVTIGSSSKPDAVGLSDLVSRLDVSHVAAAVHPGISDRTGTARLAPPSDSIPIPLPGNVYYRIAELDERPQIQTQTEPEFPLHVDPGVVGAVVLKLLIDQDGKVEDAIVVSSKPEGVFDVAAVAAFRKASFVPGKKSGKSVKTQLAIEVVFESRPFR